MMKLFVMPHEVYQLYFVLLICMLGLIFALCSGQNVLNSVCYVKEPAFIPRVIGGNPAALGEMPYQVGFKKLKNKSNFYYTFCGGVIIRENKLLSAAHCFVTGNTSISASYKVLTVPRRKLEATYAVAGTLFNHEILKRDSEGTEQWRELKFVVYPGTYKFPLKSDIAVVITLSPFLFNTYVNKIGYARHFNDYIGSCLASGYGRLSKRNKVKSEILLKARLELLPHFWCSRKLSRNMKDLVCTAITSTDIAKGDSGGPLVCFGTPERHEGDLGVLVGVASGSKLGVATFYTRVSSFAKFIEANKAPRYSTVPCRICTVTIITNSVFSISILYLK